MRLIDAEVFEELFHKQMEYGATDIFDAVEDALQDTPTIDAVPVVHAAWISEVITKKDWKGRPNHYYQPCSCSACHEPAFREYKYCPNCGARTDGDPHDGS